MKTAGATAGLVSARCLRLHRPGLLVGLDHDGLVTDGLELCLNVVLGVVLLAGLPDCVVVPGRLVVVVLVDLA